MFIVKNVCYQIHMLFVLLFLDLYAVCCIHVLQLLYLHVVYFIPFRYAKCLCYYFWIYMLFMLLFLDLHAVYVVIFRFTCCLCSFG